MDWYNSLLPYTVQTERQKTTEPVSESTILKSWKNKSIEGTNTRIKFRLVGLPVTSAAIGNFGENKAEVQLGQKSDCVRLSGPEVCLVKACVCRHTRQSAARFLYVTPSPPTTGGGNEKTATRLIFTVFLITLVPSCWTFKQKCVEQSCQQSFVVFDVLKELLRECILILNGQPTLTLVIIMRMEITNNEIHMLGYRFSVDFLIHTLGNGFFGNHKHLAKVWRLLVRGFFFRFSKSIVWYGFSYGFLSLVRTLLHILYSSTYTHPRHS